MEHKYVGLMWSLFLTLHIYFSCIMIRLGVKGRDHGVVRPLILTERRTTDMLCQILPQAPLGGGHDANSNKPWNLICTMPLRHPHRLSYRIISLDPQAFTFWLSVKWTWTVSTYLTSWDRSVYYMCMVNLIIWRKACSLYGLSYNFFHLNP